MTEALRTNMSGGKTVKQILAEAAADVPFIALSELQKRLQGRPNDLLVLDVREDAAFRAGRIPGAVNLPRGQLELRVNDEIPDPTIRIVTCCEFGKISTLAAATLRQLGYMRTVALDGGVKAWRESGFPIET
jgi:rhodanese-related sulfurtransferase